METRVQPGTLFSGIGHVSLILWVVLGDWLFAPDPVDEVQVTTISMMTSEEFTALQAAASTPEPAVEPEPQPEPVPQPEPQPEPEPAPEPEPEPEPVVEPEPEPVEAPEPEPLPEPEAPVAEEEQPLPSPATEENPLPEAAEIVAPDPVEEEETTETAETPTPAVSDTPTEAETVEQPPTEETVAEDTGDVLQTEANQEQTEATGLTTSLRPRVRPERPVEEPAPEEPTVVASEPTAEEPVEEPATDPSAIAAAVAEANTDVPAEEANTETANEDPAASDLPKGPPMSGGEKDAVRSAINRCWNVGSLSTAATRVTVRLRVEMSPEGKPTSIELASFEGGDAAAAQQAFETARRAVNRSLTGCSGGAPMQLDPEKYGEWNVMNLNFDASGVLFR
jgi:hypothetical protein